jgi:O-6-methylguanine DNA methyltransferase
MIIHRACFDTPVGKMLALASNNGVCMFEYVEDEQREERLLQKLTARFGSISVNEDSSPVLDTLTAWMDGYLASKEPSVIVPVDPDGSEFEKNVWQQLLHIRYGTVISYGDIARTFNDISLSRAVGRAVGNNPVAIIIPCHRVIGSNGHLTGYAGGIERKKWLLAHEGYGLPY